MEEELYAAMVDLKSSIDKQNELQETSNNIMRALVDALQGNAQATEDCRSVLAALTAKRDG